MKEIINEVFIANINFLNKVSTIIKRDVPMAFFSLLSIFLFLLLITLTQCAPATTEPQRLRGNENLSKAESKIISSSGQFGLNLIKEISNTEPDKNIIISPLSVSTAFGMVLNGSNNETYGQIKNVLGLGNLKQDEINSSFKSVNKLLCELDNKVEFSSSNSIWYRNNFSVEKYFIEVNKNYFDAEVKEADFSDPKTPGLINDWVKNATKSKIEKIIERIDDNMIMYLINAIYFKGTWKYQFDKNVTSEDDFYVSPDQKVKCQMMAQKNKFLYFSNADYDAVELEYGNGSYSMMVFLPRDGKFINNLLQDFSSEGINKVRENFKEKELTLFLPKFKLEYESTLNDFLVNLGMRDAFNPNLADFTGINKSGGLFISEVKHKTFIEVNEEGTEAAAVTSIGVSLTSANVSQIFLRIDRPFLFTIVEKNTNTILFIGKIINPN